MNQKSVNEEKNTAIPSGKVTSASRSATASELDAAPSFTPGPWVALDDEEGRNYARVRGTRLGGRYKIANVLFVVGHAAEVAEARANARLITAAPALYAAAKVLDSIDWIIGYSLTESNMRVLDEALDKARAALAVADGQDTA